jgi:poly-gamma-glutamate capsule biosynthesis protein CapA/YwtB (metallophosphatase superfamily)
MIHKFIIISIVLSFQLNLAFCQQNNNTDHHSDTLELKKFPDNKSDSVHENKISFLCMGDIMSHDLQIQSAYDKSTGKYDFSTEFKDIQPIIKDVDVTIGNLEVTLAGPPYSGYPMFSSPDQMAIDIKNAGIKYVVTANNHINDRGIKGFLRTMDVLDSVGLKHTGTFRNAEDKQNLHPMIIDEKGWRIALFNYTYGVNGNAYDLKMIINEIDSAQIVNDLSKAKKQNYDAIIIFFHWGDEYKRNSNATQQKLAKMCFENGANAVIGSHPHVVQEMEKYTFKTSSGVKKDALVAYSLGNYVANYGSWRYTNGGAMIRFSFSKLPDGQIKIDDQGYYLIWVYRKEKTDTLKTYYVLPISQFENDKMITGEHLKLFNQFKTDMRTHLKMYNKNVNEYIYNKNTKKWEIKN